MKKDFFWKLWETVNIITGFAAVQSLTFAFLFISDEKLALKIKPFYVLLGMSGSIILGGILYSFGVFYCIKWAKKFIISENNLDENKLILKSLNFSILGRIIAIAFFTLLDVLVLWLVNKYAGICIEL